MVHFCLKPCRSGAWGVRGGRGDAALFLWRSLRLMIMVVLSGYLAPTVPPDGPMKRRQSCVVCVVDWYLLFTFAFCWFGFFVVIL